MRLRSLSVISKTNMPQKKSAYQIHVVTHGMPQLWMLIVHFSSRWRRQLQWLTHQPGYVQRLLLSPSIPWHCYQPELHHYHLKMYKPNLYLITIVSLIMLTCYTL